jgi:hypothetical protein
VSEKNENAIVSVWNKFRSRPIWIQILTFVFVAAFIAFLFLRGFGRNGKPSSTIHRDQAEITDDILASENDKDYADLKRLEDEVDVIVAERKEQEAKQAEYHGRKENEKDEIRNADSISDVTNVLRNRGR